MNETQKIRRKKCYLIYNRALRNGVLKRGKRCRGCNKIKASIHGHHTNYSKPLKVKWLCNICHRQEHSRLDFNRKYPQYRHLLTPSRIAFYKRLNNKNAAPKI